MYYSAESCSPSIQSLVFMVQANPFCPLHWAAIINHVDAAKILVSHGAETHAEDHAVGLHTAQRYCKLLDSINQKIFLYMCMQGLTPLTHACIFGHTNMAQCLLLRGADPSFAHRQTVSQSLCGLHTGLCGARVLLKLFVLQTQNHVVVLFCSSCNSLMSCAMRHFFVFNTYWHDGKLR